MRINNFALPSILGNTTYDIKPRVSAVSAAISEMTWLIHGMNLIFATDATVANRTLQVTYMLLTGGNPLGFTFQTTAIAASQTKYISMGGITYLVSAVSGQDFFVGIPKPIAVNSIQALRITVVNGVVGDTVTGFINYEELPS